jgi:CRISPR-associated endonuclease/helicase Cas3
MKRPKVATNKTSVTALPLDQCLAKTYIADDGKKSAGRLVFDHCHIVGEVARELVARMPSWLQAELFPAGCELISACHDIGKSSPTFQEKIYRGTEGYRCNSIPELQAANPALETAWGGHGGISQATADALNVGKYIPEILGQHHGYSPRLSHTSTADVFGGLAWEQQRIELMGLLKQAEFPSVTSGLQARVLSGLTSVADWIGSSSWFEQPDQDWRPVIKQALDDAGFVQAQIKPGLDFVDVFGFTPHETQAKLIASCTQSGVYVLEAPMGSGKTEAALYAAYKMLSHGLATGLYFALPTQLTSDKIHGRVNAFLEKILPEDDRHREALLLHGLAWLKKDIGEEGRPSGSWFDQGKRGILAPFAVGTIDQALMAVMNVKHGFVRAFGLAGKVVILDEVHSYDAYTGTLLDELVQALRQLHCTVIILSATLTQQRRAKLLEAVPQSADYPLITAKPNQAPLQEMAISAVSSANVSIQCHHQDDAAIEQALERAELGQQVLWIENTVAEAQALYRKLSARAGNMGIACGLLHSRFLKVDRAHNEGHWVALYGKDNAEARQAKGRILIGTQVLEQSLDIDADFLVTRFAPTDMLLQRLGRLWRHSASWRPETARREAWLLVPELGAAIDNAETRFGNSAKVYSPYVLCRSLEVWHLQDAISLPGQIRELIEATYSERPESGKMQRYLKDLETTRDKLRRLALVGLSQAGSTLPENKASTRHSEQDSVQVLLLRKFRKADNNGTALTLLSGEEITLPRFIKRQDRRQWRDLAIKLIQNTVQVADYLAPQAVSVSDLKWLAEYFYLGDPAQGESLLRVALVDASGDIKGLNGGVATEKYHLSYDPKLGYLAEK